MLGFQADLASGSTTQEFRASAVKLLSLGKLDNTNGISAVVENNEPIATQYYTLNGTRLSSQPQKGFYIVKNGVKTRVVVR